MSPRWQGGGGVLGIVLILLTAKAACVTNQCEGSPSPSPTNARAQVFRDVMCQYDKRVPPKELSDVRIAMFIRTAKVVESTLEMEALADVWWQDKSLVWDHTTSLVDEIEVASEDIWTPDIATIVTLNWERNGDPQDTIWPATCHVRWNGTVHCISALDVGGDCEVSALHWPSQEASCVVYIGLDVNNNFGALLVTESDSYQGYIPGNDWVVTNITQYSSVGLGPSVSVAVAFKVMLQSRGKAQSTALLGPGVVLSILITASFCLPISSPIRLGLCCCATFGTVLASAFLFAALPPVEGPTPIVVTSYCGLLFLSGVATLTTIGLATLLSMQRKPSAPPRWLYSVQAWLLNTNKGRALLSYLLLSPKEKAGETTAEVAAEETHQVEGTDAERNYDNEEATVQATCSIYGPHKLWDFIAVFLNRCFLLLYTLSCFAICIHIGYMLIVTNNPDFDIYE